MKKLIVLFLATLLLQGCDRHTQSGRFQIVPGTYDEIVNYEIGKNSTSSQRQGIFKIDTQTGQAWIYLDATDLTTNGWSTTEGWREINSASQPSNKPIKTYPKDSN
jgi:hypothetical protein